VELIRFSRKFYDPMRDYFPRYQVSISEKTVNSYLSSVTPHGEKYDDPELSHDPFRGGLASNTYVSLIAKHLSKKIYPILTGKVGEYAVYTMFRDYGVACSAPDLEKRKYGDGGIDLRMVSSSGKKYSIDVKRRKARGEPLLYEVIGYDGKERRIPSADLFVGVDWDTGPLAYVSGWTTRAKLLKLRRAKSWKGNHENIEATTDDLSCFLDLLEIAAK
jgi:hypothetical protein